MGARHKSLLHSSLFEVGTLLNFPDGVGQTEEMRPKKYLECKVQRV